MIPYAQLIKPEPKKLTKVQRAEQLKNICNQNIGKRIEVYFYTSFESTKVYETIRGKLDKCFGDDLSIWVKDGMRFVSVYNVIGYRIEGVEV